MAKIAVIGLGNMGGAMAANLVDAGHNVAGYDQAAGAVKSAKANGVSTVGSLESALMGAEFVITMLPDSAAVRSVLLGPEGVFASLSKGAVVIDSSTVDVRTARDLHLAAIRAGHSFVDAPVSGGMTGARGASLTFMVGGEAEIVDLVTPVLMHMGARVVHAGGAGAGAAAKIVNNMLLGISLGGVCEAFVLSERLGLDQDVFYDIASTSSGDCWALRTWTPVPGIVDAAPSSHGWTPGFSTDLMLKDLRLANEAAQEVESKLEMAATILNLFERHHDAGFGGKDCSSLIEGMRSREVRQ